MQTSTLEPAPLREAPARSARLEIRREDIRFGSEPSGDVRLEITVRNLGGEPSAPAVVRVEAAPFGVFVPWRPLREIAVPPVPAHGEIVMRTWLTADRPPSLGRPDRVPPKRLLTAFGLHEGDADLLSAVKGWFSPSRKGRLPADMFRVLGQGGAHWIGNLNVFLNDVPVERHRARALRVHAGCRNLALFFLGSGEDSYRFAFQGNAMAWSPRIHDLVGRRNLGDVAGAEPLPEHEWIVVRSTRILALVFEPKAHSGERDLEVVVRQRSTDRVASVEFTLDPAAAGPGCYVME